MASLIGQTIDGKYLIQKELGRGGMGAVYLATHVGTERPVAVKVIAPQLMRSEEFVERFKREARASGRLRHPNVVDVTDFGFAQVDSLPMAYLVMEYLDGCTLAQVLAEEPRLPLSSVVDIIDQVCSAVGEAHHQGIVHRDIKPDNIWLEPNRRGGFTIKVLDFGLAKLGDAAGPLDAIEGRRPEGLLREPYVSQFVSNPGGQTNAGSGNGGVATNPGGLADVEGQTPTVLLADAAHTQATVGAEVGEGELAANTVAHSEDNTLVQTPGSGSAGQGGGANPTGLPNGSPGGAEAEETEARTVMLPGDAGTQTGRSGTPPGHQAPSGETQRVAADDRTLIQPSGATGAERSGTQPAPNRTDSFSNHALLTQAGSILGTPVYMSPEQCLGRPLDGRTDIYSIGVVAYQLLAGAPPFTGGMNEVMKCHIDSAPRNLKEAAPAIRRKVAEVVMSSLAKNSAERPQTAEAFASALRAQSEGSAALVRRALTIFSEHLGTFLKLAVIVYSPTIFFSLLEAIPILFVPAKGKPSVAILVIAAVLQLLMTISAFLTVPILIGVTTRLVTQILAAPLSPLELKPAFAFAKTRLKKLLPVSIGLSIATSIGFFLCLAPGLYLLFNYSLASPVIMIEGLKGKAALRRAKALAGRARRTVISIMLLQFVIPFLTSALSQFVLIGLAKAYTPSISERLAGVNAVAPILISLVLGTFFSITTALLYWKTRMAGGETLKEALGQFGESDACANWQERMYSRLSLTTPSSRTSV